MMQFFESVAFLEIFGDYLIHPQAYHAYLPLQCGQQIKIEMKSGRDELLVIDQLNALGEMVYSSAFELWHFNETEIANKISLMEESFPMWDKLPLWLKKIRDFNPHFLRDEIYYHAQVKTNYFTPSVHEFYVMLMANFAQWARIKPLDLPKWFGAGDLMLEVRCSLEGKPILGNHHNSDLVTSTCFLDHQEILNQTYLFCPKLSQQEVHSWSGTVQKQNELEAQNILVKNLMNVSNLDDWILGLNEYQEHYKNLIQKECPFEKFYSDIKNGAIKRIRGYGKNLLMYASHHSEEEMLKELKDKELIYLGKLKDHVKSRSHILSDKQIASAKNYQYGQQSSNILQLH